MKKGMAVLLARISSQTKWSEEIFRGKGCHENGKNSINDGKGNRGDCDLIGRVEDIFVVDLLKGCRFLEPDM